MHVASFPGSFHWSEGRAWEWGYFPRLFLLWFFLQKLEAWRPGNSLTQRGRNKAVELGSRVVQSNPGILSIAGSWWAVFWSTGPPACAQRIPGRWRGCCRSPLYDRTYPRSSPQKNLHHFITTYCVCLTTNILYHWVHCMCLTTNILYHWVHVCNYYIILYTCIECIWTLMSLSELATSDNLWKWSPSL